MTMAEKTIGTDPDGVKYIVVQLDNGQRKWVDRKSYRQMKKCKHDWRTVAYDHRGHGKWRAGCKNCGALAR
jgi:hypothetical protein